MSNVWKQRKGRVKKQSTGRGRPHNLQSDGGGAPDEQRNQQRQQNQRPRGGGQQSSRGRGQPRNNHPQSQPQQKRGPPSGQQQMRPPSGGQGQRRPPPGHGQQRQSRPPGGQQQRSGGQGWGGNHGGQQRPPPSRGPQNRHPQQNQPRSQQQRQNPQADYSRPKPVANQQQNQNRGRNQNQNRGNNNRYQNQNRSRHGGGNRNQGGGRHHGGGNRGGGRGHGNRPPPSNNLKPDRYAETFSESMQTQIRVNNDIDDFGVKLVEHTQLLNPDGTDSGWKKIQSLSRHKPYYFHNTVTNVKTFKNDAVKDCLEGETIWKPSRHEHPLRKPTEELQFPGMRQIQVVTNSYHVANYNEIRELTVYTYNVHFDPPVDPKDGLERKNALFGTSKQERNQIQKRLQAYFGVYEFNNLVLHSLGRKSPESPLMFTNLAGTHKVIFTRASQQAFENWDSDDRTRSAFLSLFVRRKMHDSDYVKLDRGGTYFPRSKGTFVPLQNTRQYQALLGYDATVQFDMHQGASLTSDVRPVFIENKTVWQRIDECRKHNPGDPQFQKVVKQLLNERHVIVQYNKQSVRIDRVDFKANNNTKPDGMDETYAGYLQRKYGKKSPKKELCVLINVDKRDGSESGFLPQHCNLKFETAIDDSVLPSCKALVDEPLNYRIPRINDFVAEIASGSPAVQKNKQRNWGDVMSLEFETQNQMAKAVILQQPHITFYGAEGRTKPKNITLPYIYGLTREQQIQWRFSKGPMDGGKPMPSWIVVIREEDMNYRIRPKRGAPMQVWEYIQNEHKGFLRARGFHKSLLPPPRLVTLPAGCDIEDPRVYSRLARGGDAVVLGILPEGEIKSQLKQEMSRAFSLKSSRTPVQTQFIDIEKVGAAHRMKTIFDMILLKNGNKMYQLLPIQPPNPVLKLDDIWTIGIVVDVNPDNGHWPIACLTVLTDACCGSLDVVFPVCHYMYNKKRIIPYEVVIAMMVKACKKAYAKTKRLPKQVIVLRDGLSEGQFPELYSKEIAGIQRAVVKDVPKALKKKKWKPATAFMVVQKGILDRFSVPDNRGNGLKEVIEPTLCYDGPLSKKYWDFLLQVTCKREGGARPSKYVILQDRIGLKTNPTTVGELFNYIHALHYGYVPMVPWPNGPSAVPSPLKYAAHFAETLHQNTREIDQHPGSLDCHPSLIYRPQVIDDDDFPFTTTNETQI